MQPAGFLIVVPAHNEAALIPRALSALRLAMDSAPKVESLVVVVADRCNDGTAEAVRAISDRRIALLEVQFGSAGATRRHGVTQALHLMKTRGVSADQTWIANTDADSVVPPNWLNIQANFAREGFEAVVGTVQPRATPPPNGALPEQIRLWHKKHPLGENHPYIFGANLGLSATAYRKAGGFAAVNVGEDAALVAALRRQGSRIKATDRNRVTTSARLDSHVNGGFATFLSSL